MADRVEFTFKNGKTKNMDKPLAMRLQNRKKGKITKVIAGHKNSKVMAEREETVLNAEIQLEDRETALLEKSNEVDKILETKEAVEKSSVEIEKEKTDLQDSEKEVKEAEVKLKEQESKLSEMETKLSETEKALAKKDELLKGRESKLVNGEKALTVAQNKLDKEALKLSDK